MNTKIFISYSDFDKRKVELFQDVFSNYANFKLIIIANNRTEMISLANKVTDGIKEADYFIPIMTRTSMSTQWMNQEIGYAISLRDNAKPQLRILPVVENQVMKKLKGFVHKELDIPFSFEGIKSNRRAESIRFKKTITFLRDYLVEKNDKNLMKSNTASLYDVLTSKQFNFIFNPQTGRSKILKFSSDGTFLKGGNKNENNWGIEGNKLIIRNSEGKIYSSFEYDPDKNRLQSTNEANALALKDQYMEPIL
ncbi:MULTISPECIES: toll/interleukin-1 receptor domain-containing protein [unclassified Leptospira]|uniref:toll/interleukin-1 receptor domain-containing protein n=1 Tax=unclassified Leptospira TaxID=2633828 RepID=UPI0009D9635F|nr:MULTISPECIES: toll/interleukin-1 receptor domain-containing protein [unclassified Leptospira]MCR1795760.1 toll/interleukin-1 receptor domain-containing protein [Leptospira sp. id769339]